MPGGSCSPLLTEGGPRSPARSELPLQVVAWRIFRLRYCTRLNLRDAALRNTEPKRVCCVILLLPSGIFQRLVRKDCNMFRKQTRSCCAAALIAALWRRSGAKQNNPAGNMGSNRSATGTPGTADSNDVRHAHRRRHAPMRHRQYSGSAMNSTTPGATGTDGCSGLDQQPGKFVTRDCGTEDGCGQHGWRWRRREVTQASSGYFPLAGCCKCACSACLDRAIAVA